MGSLVGEPYLKRYCLIPLDIAMPVRLCSYVTIKMGLVWVKMSDTGTLGHCYMPACKGLFRCYNKDGFGMGQDVCYRYSWTLLCLYEALFRCTIKMGLVWVKMSDTGTLGHCYACKSLFIRYNKDGFGMGQDV